ncbi:MAG: YncE family protein, partial [Balneolaceae bacterium]
MNKMISFFISLIFLLISASSTAVYAQTYYVYVAAESEDEISLIHLNPATEKGSVLKNIKVGEFPTEIEGPHGMRMGPDGEYWYYTLAHGIPFGYLYKHKTGSDEMVGRVELGMFPATFDYSPVTGWFYIVNFDLHGDHVPSTVSVVDPVEMVEIEQIVTGVMPHGARVSPDGLRMYHASMMTDEVMVMNTVTLEIEKRIPLSKKKQDHQMSHSNHHSMMHASDSGSEPVHEPVASPTWVHPNPVKPYIYATGNRNNKIYEISTETWEITNEWDSDKGPYNLEIISDGKLLVVTYKGAGRTGIWDLETGMELANIENSRKVTHGVVISPDDRFAFVSVEGIGGEPGS